MRRTIKMMITGVLFFKRNVDKKKKGEKKSYKIQENPKILRNEDLLNKKRLDQFIDLLKNLSFYEQKTVLKGSTVAKQNLIKITKKKIHRPKLSRLHLIKGSNRK